MPPGKQSKPRVAADVARPERALVEAVRGEPDSAGVKDGGDAGQLGRGAGQEECLDARLTDPFDSRSRDDDAPLAIGDQYLGIGDGIATRFPLVKHYGGDDPFPRRITRPVAASVVVGIGGVGTSAWRLSDLGNIDFTVAPAAGAVVTAGFAFDVPVRFADDRIDITAGGWRSGDAASVPLVELREG